MITYDYSLKRKVGDQVQEFLPNEALKIIPDIAYIKGPNSSGKSTLLNILALSFYGLELSSIEIPNQLKNRIEGLLETDHQQLTFSVRVENEITKDHLVIEKSNPYTREVFLYKIVSGEKKPLSPDSFKREFRLLYDIPIDPLERLPGLLNEVRSTQFKVGNRIYDFRSYLQQLIDEIKESKNPGQISKLAEDIADIKDDILTIDNSITTKESEIKEITTYLLMRKWINLDEAINKMEEQLGQLNSQIKVIGEGSRREAKDYTRKQSKLRSNLQEIKNLISDIRRFLVDVVADSDQQRFSLWKNANPEEEIYHPGLIDELRIESQYFESALRKRFQNKRQKLGDVIEKVKLYKVLLQALDEYKFNDTLIPGLNKPVKNFITLLQEESEKYSVELNDLSNYEKYADSLHTLLSLVDESIILAKDFQNSREGVREGSISINELLSEKDNLESSLNQTKEELNDIQLKLHPLNLKEVKEYIVPLRTSPIIQIHHANSDAQITESIEWLNKNVKEDKAKRDDKRRVLNHAETEMERLQKKEPHPLFSSLSVLENYLQKIRFLEKEFKVNFEEYIKRAIDAKKSTLRIDIKEQHYQEELGKLLGLKIGTIRHITDYYEIDRIDVFEKNIYTTSGVEIKYTDLGTGQGQAAYLEALLGMQSDKKVIALFDEVAMMDENSLQPIKEKLRAMYENGKLLAAIIVQKDEALSIESII